MPSDLPQLSPIELNRIVSLKEAAKLAGVSEDTLRRKHSDKILQVSERRQGMRTGHALMLGQSKKSA